ncbi:energy transducer TonB [uncultured Winogradskyella sp.]|uniref:energy transducer TonB n=1 Tax=uncultured Winogradskyella sp. TaxID=395353 RepID=UPI00261B36D3|nr:energy transducer TonB [uncultured Winogradskyella sp.]
MKNFKKDFGIAGQSTTKAKKSQKHDANLQKNSTLYFQIGLILCLLGTYALFEMQFQEKKLIIDSVGSDEVATIDVVEKFRVEPEVIEKKQKEVKQTILIDKVIEKPDDYLEKDPIDLIVSDPTPLSSEPVADPNDIVDAAPIESPITMPFDRIEQAPVYPGCERHKTNDKRKKCMSEKITKLINKKFNTDIGSEYGMSGRQRINTQFTIDKNGDIIDVKIRGPHFALENEAKRVINKIPKMKPGIQGKKSVGVIYTLPIVFDVRDY